MAKSCYYPECRHIMPSGRRCGSPALRGKMLCVHHSRTTTLTEVNRPRKHSVALPPLEDRAAIQMSLTEVVAALAAGKLSRREAGTYLYALDLAGRNLTRLEQLPPPDPSELVQDEHPEIPADAPPLAAETHEPGAPNLAANSPLPEPAPAPASETPETDPLFDDGCTHEFDPEPPPRLSRTEMRQRISDIQLDLRNLRTLQARYAAMPVGSEQKPEIVLAYAKEKIEEREAELQALHQQDTPDPPARWPASDR